MTKYEPPEKSLSKPMIWASMAVVAAVLCHLLPWVQVQINNNGLKSTVTGTGFGTYYGIASGISLGLAILVMVILAISQTSPGGKQNAALIILGLTAAALISQLAMYSEMGAKKISPPRMAMEGFGNSPFGNISISVNAAPQAGLLISHALCLTAIGCCGYELAGSKKKNQPTYGAPPPSPAEPPPNFANLK